LFDLDSGLLPPDEHGASQDDVSDRFGWDQVRRCQLDGLNEALGLLTEAGCSRTESEEAMITNDV